ncbi:tc5 transposase DNA-binding domain-containing protein [Ditylenchus destructor]|nr:tc5 transposase DNA-binding domain-containing protein [Ditylenchus destructor]
MEKQTRRVLSLQQKKDILDAHEKEKSWVKLSKQFGLPESTIQTIVSNKHKILSALDQGYQAKRSRLQPAKHPELEKATVSWLKSAKSQNIKISGPLIQEKAKEFAKDLNITNFEASNGWLSNLKQRHSISLHPEQAGEARVVSIESLEEWRQKVCTNLLTAAVPTKEEIAYEFPPAIKEETKEDKGSEEITEDRPRVSEQEAYKAMQIVRDYIQSNYTDPAVLKHTDELEDIIRKDCMSKKKEKDQ